MVSKIFLRKSRPEINSDLGQGHTGWLQGSRNCTHSPHAVIISANSYPVAKIAVHCLSAHDCHLVVTMVIAAYAKNASSLKSVESLLFCEVLCVCYPIQSFQHYKGGISIHEEERITCLAPGAVAASHSSPG